MSTLSQLLKVPSPEKIRWFQKELLDRGYITTVRVTMGKDILAACGQLKSELEKPNLWKKEQIMA